MKIFPEYQVRDMSDEEVELGQSPTDKKLNEGVEVPAAIIVEQHSDNQRASASNDNNVANTNDDSNEHDEWLEHHPWTEFNRMFFDNESLSSSQEDDNQNETSELLPQQVKEDLKTVKTDSINVLTISFIKHLLKSKQ